MPHIVSLTHPELAEAVARSFQWPTLSIEVSRFASGESRLRIPEQLSSKEVFVVHSTQKPVDRNIVLYGNLIDALRFRGAEKIISFFPWLGYSLQDRRFSDGESQAFQVATQLLRTPRVTSSWALDVHTPESLPKSWNMLSAWPLFEEDLRATDRHKEVIFVSPDEGSEKRVRAFASHMHVPFLCLQKNRFESGRVNTESLLEKESQHVSGKKVVLLDDVINSGSTMIEASRVLKEAGAKKIYVYATHGLLVGQAVERLLASDIDEIVITDSISTAVEHQQKKLRIITIAGLLMSQFESMKH